MKENKYSLLVKPVVIRLSELASSLQIINDSFSLIEKGKLYQFIPIYGQLRSLLIEKSKKMKPLLFEIADVFNEKLELFYIPFKPLPDNLPGPYMQFDGPEISIEKTNTKHVAISLKDFLNEDVVLLISKKYKIDDIIKTMANKYGGSHYASKIEEDIVELLSFKIFNQTIYNHLIFQIGKVTLSLGTRVIQKLNQLTFYYTIYIPDQQLDEQQYLCDYYSKNYGLRYSLIISKEGIPKLLILDLNKNLWVFDSEKPISFNSFLSIQVIIGFSSDLKSIFRLKINDDILIDKQFECFIPISNEMHLFDCYYNRSLEKENDGLNVIFYQTLIMATIPDENETKSTMTSIGSELKTDKKAYLFSKGNYGITLHGERHIKICENVEFKSVDELLSAK
jgi:hypothetical protein